MNTPFTAKCDQLSGKFSQTTEFILGDLMFRILSALLIAALPVTALAQDADPRFELELNAATETANGNCRLTFVAKNGSDSALDQTQYEVAIFDAEGIFSSLLVLKFGALVEGKTRVRQFELPGTTCSGISRIIINDSAACVEAGTGADTDFCMSALDATSRTAIQFGI